MYRDPRCTKYRKPRSFYGTPFGKYINAAIGISCVIIYAFSYGLSHIPLLQETVNKLRYDINSNFNRSDLVELYLEKIVQERLNIKEEEEEAKNENKEVHI